MGIERKVDPYSIQAVRALKKAMHTHNSWRLCRLMNIESSSKVCASFMKDITKDGLRPRRIESYGENRRFSGTGHNESVRSIGNHYLLHVETRHGRRVLSVQTEAFKRHAIVTLFGSANPQRRHAAHALFLAMQRRNCHQLNKVMDVPLSPQACASLFSHFSKHRVKLLRIEWAGRNLSQKKRHTLRLHVETRDGRRVLRLITAPKKGRMTVRIVGVQKP